ncbi:MAG: hypothetical protein ACYC3I_20345 [Gemmataceae bacterium]
MRRMPRGAVGVFLAIGIVVSARWASSQAPNPRLRGQPGQVAIIDVTPGPISANSLDAQEGELRLPIGELPKPNAEKIRGDTKARKPLKLPVKWGRPTEGWETQVKKLEAVNAPRASSRKEPALPTAASAAKPSISAAAAARPNSRRPGNAEESEPKNVAETEDRSASTPSQALRRSERRWPPAYAAKPTTGTGRPGVIAFEEEVPRASAKATSSHSLEPAVLQSRVKSLCGSQARDVSVAAQRDGTMLVTVKVDNRSIEDKLSLKILSIPEMTAPKVRLLMDVGP